MILDSVIDPSSSASSGNRSRSIPIGLRGPNPSGLPAERGGPSSIVLTEKQIPHFEKLCSNILRAYGYIDGSVMGAGKTYVSCAIAQRYNLSLLVICPVTVTSVWQTVAGSYGIPVVDIIGFEKLRSTKNHQPTHGLLTRFDAPAAPGGVKTKTSFSATPYFLEWVDAGILLVIDECQRIKNDTDQNRACKTLTAAVCDRTSPSRFGLLSGSPFDKEEHAINVMKVMGFVRDDKMYDYNRTTKKYELTGALRLISVCNLYEPDITETYARSRVKSATDVTHLCYQLFLQVLKPRMMSAMPSPVIDVVMQAINGYYDMDEYEVSRLILAIRQLKSAARYNESTGRVDLRDVNLGAITNALMAIEKSKLKILVRKARETLDAAPGKVILYLSYTSSIDYLASELQDFAPLILHGKVVQKKRNAIIEKFRDNPDSRLMIANIKVGGVGISLHDTVGDQPRTTFLIPNYSVIDLHQAAYRTYRMGTKSEVKIYFVYGNVALKESSILDALARKTAVLKDNLDQQVEERVLFPGDYPEWIESGVPAFGVAPQPVRRGPPRSAGGSQPYRLRRDAKSRHPALDPLRIISRKQHSLFDLLI